MLSQSTMMFAVIKLCNSAVLRVCIHISVFSKQLMTAVYVCG